jgi:hypothetical protein
MKHYLYLFFLSLAISANAQNIGINNTNPQAALDINGDLRLRSVTLSSVTAGLNLNVDINNTPAVKSSVYMFSPLLLSIQIGGFNGGVDGRIITVFNNTAGAVQLYNEFASSVDVNRILTGTSNTAIIYGNGSATLRYDGAKMRWTIVSSNYTDGLSATSGGSGPWITNGNNISNGNTGNVGIAEPNPTEKLHVSNGNVKIGENEGWTGVADDRTLKFGDGNFVSIGEVGGDDKMEIRGKDITLNSTNGNVVIPKGYLYVGLENPSPSNTNSLVCRGGLQVVQEGKLNITGDDGEDNLLILNADKNTIQAQIQLEGDPNILPSSLKINPAGGNIGIGNTGLLQNKLQLGNPPGFSGNDIAIGNGTQAMSLFQSPIASIFYTNTNFAFMPLMVLAMSV